MSSTLPGRPIGVPASKARRARSSFSTTASASVSTPPTEIAFTRTLGASSAARFLVTMFSAAFPAA